ncbi:MAG: hypothetical protein Ct9H300mP15_12840 [Gemmatimonadota bacterium]|nr:MAG: hypothetical protein Ct9H300mP15_12840 [Gemmatimonadota bacterium]
MPWKQLVPHARRPFLRPKTDYSFPMLAPNSCRHNRGRRSWSYRRPWSTAWSGISLGGLDGLRGLGTHGCLELASNDGAYFLGAEDDIGSLAVGKLADLMIPLNLNPLETSVTPLISNR